MLGLHDELRTWGWDGASPDKAALTALLESDVLRRLTLAVRGGHDEAIRRQAHLLMDQAADLGLNPVWAQAYPLSRGACAPEPGLRALYRTLRQLRDILNRY